MRLQYPSGHIYEVPDNADQATINALTAYDKSIPPIGKAAARLNPDPTMGSSLGYAPMNPMEMVPGNGKMVKPVLRSEAPAGISKLAQSGNLIAQGIQKSIQGPKAPQKPVSKPKMTVLQAIRKDDAAQRKAKAEQLAREERAAVQGIARGTAEAGRQFREGDPVEQFANPPGTPLAQRVPTGIMDVGGIIGANTDPNRNARAQIALFGAPLSIAGATTGGATTLAGVILESAGMTAWAAADPEGALSNLALMAPIGKLTQVLTGPALKGLRRGIAEYKADKLAYAGLKNLVQKTTQASARDAEVLTSLIRDSKAKDLNLVDLAKAREYTGTKAIIPSDASAIPPGGVSMEGAPLAGFRKPQPGPREIRVEGGEPVASSVGKPPVAEPPPPVVPKQGAAKPSTKISQALEGASAERQAAFEKMQTARAAQSIKGGTGFGSAPSIRPLLPEEIDYFKSWAKEKGLQGAKAVEDFIQHIAEFGEDVGRWRAGLKAQLPQEVAPTPVEDFIRSTGIANQVQEREALKGIIKEIDPSGGKDPDWWQQRGEDILREKGNGNANQGMFYAWEVANRASEGGALHPDDFAVMLAGKRQLLNERSGWREYVKTTGDAGGLENLQRADDALQSFLEKVQQGKGLWSDMGRAMQAGVELSTGSYDDVLEAVANARGIKMADLLDKSKKQYEGLRRKYENLTGQVKRREDKLVELNSKLDGARVAGQVESAARRERTPYTRERARQDIGDAFAQFKANAAALRAQANDVATVVGTLTAEGAILVGKVGWSLAKAGVHDLGELTKSVRQLVKENLGQDVTDQEIIDAMRPQTSGRTVSDAQKAISKLTRQIKQASTTGRTEKMAEWNAQIQGYKESLARGEFHKPTKEEIMLEKQVEQLKAERDFYSKRVKFELSREPIPKWRQAISHSAQAIRSLTLAQDVGVATRQLLFLNPLIAPVAFGKGIANAMKAVRSDAMLQGVMRSLEERNIDGWHMGAMRKKYGLSLSDILHHREEFISLQELGNIGRRISESKFGQSKIGGAIGAIPGSLERFQTALMNTARAEAFDRAFALGLDEGSLRTRAAYLNAVTGRGNVSRIPELLGDIMTSPRYEVSRWQTIGRTVKDPALVFGSAYKSLVAGQGLKNINKGAVWNAGHHAVVAAEIYGLFKLAERAGYTVNWDPTASGFMQMRKGDEVWDVSAGLAPRIRDIMRAAIWAGNPGYNANWRDLIAGVTTRTISPGVRTPVTLGAYAYQSSKGQQPTDPFTGYKAGEGDFTDWRALMPFTVQTFWQAQNSPPTSPIWAAFREFIGGSVKFYPEKSSGKGGSFNFDSGNFKAGGFK